MSLNRWLSFVVLGREAVREPRRKPRRGPARDWRYRAWVRTFECACGCGRSPCHAAHTVNNGMRSKGDDYYCVPLWWRCHFEYDSGREAFEQKHGIRMTEVVKRLNQEWKLRFAKGE